jgi:ubiquinone/menaquinone biosynthesis C-methylase UbiE
MSKLYFPQRVAEPKKMTKLELELFEKKSKENYKHWLISFVDDALEKSELKKGKILDIGCGSGLLVKEFAYRSKKFYVMGIDTSLHALRLAKKNCQKLKNSFFKKTSVYHLPFSNYTFDLVTCKDTLHHFNDLKSAIKEMYRVTKKGGMIYLQDLRRNMPWYLLKMVIPPQNNFQKLQYYSARAAYTKKELISVFNVLNIKNYIITTRQLRKKLRKRYKALGGDLEKIKEAFQARYVAVIKKKNVSAHLTKY